MATQRINFVTVSRAGLTFAAALGLARVYRGGSWVVPVFLAAAIPPIVLGYMEHRRRHPLWGIALALLIGTWLAILLDDPSETVAGIPSGAALSSFGHDLANSPHILRSAVVPVDPVGAALVLAFVATFVAALATYLIARHLDAPLGAIGPSIALYVAIAALGSGKWAATTACYALVIVAYLVALQYEEVSARRTWFQSRRAHRSQMLSGGVVVGALAIAFAIAIGPLFPGARGGALINYRKLGSGQGASVLNAPSPFLSIATKLSRDAESEVFTVETSDAETNPNGYRWRAIALDTFNGDNDQWGLDAKQSSTEHLDPPTGADNAVRVRQSFHINAAVDPYWLPAAYRPYRLDLPGASVLPASATLFLPKGSVAGVTYNVESEVRIPTPEELRTVSGGEIDSMPDETKLPPHFPDRVRELAESLTRQAATPYDKAIALERFFQSNLFTYDQSVDYSSSPRALEQFVFEKRRGFCEQFAAAFAEMARSIDLPTRVAVGYQAGKPDAGGVFHVKGADAHAWPEVWLGARFGWYPFEPTKGRSDPVTGRGGPPAGGSTTPSTGSTPTTVATGATTPQGSNTTVPNPDSVLVAPTPPSSSPPATGGRVLRGIGVTLAVLFIGALALIAVLAISAIRRTRKRRHAVDTRGRVLGAWNEAMDRLRAAGVVPRPAATSIEFALRHAPAHGAGGAGPPLMGLARLHSAAMFAPEPPSESDAEAAWVHVDAIDAALRETVSRSERWVTRLRLRRRDR